jgi:glycosyltransferase involved in cell wall biosynthesis
MSAPVITIGLPVYNAAPFLEDALRSVFAQTFTSWELLAVDDGSTDDGLRRLQNLGDPRVRVLSDGRHRGLAARLNQVVREARGQFIARMDADDLIHPERLARQLDFLQQHPELDAIGCGVIVLGRNLEPVGMRDLPPEHEQICARLPGPMGLLHASAFSRAAWSRRHPYKEDCACEDQDLWFSTYRTSRFGNLPAPLYFYRELESFSAGKHTRAKLDFIEVLWRWRVHFGRFRTLRMIARQLLAAGIYALASFAGLAPRLLRRRNRPLDAASREQFQSALARIRATPLPLRKVGALS